MTFAYHRPRTVEAFWDTLAGSPGGVQLLSGGTDVLVGLNKGTSIPAAVVDLKGLDVLRSDIAAVDGRLRVGALNVMTDLIRDERVRRHFPALVEAAAEVGSVQIRNRATLAGNICNASPAADTAPPLLVYEAVVEILGPTGDRGVPLDEFFAGPRVTVLEPGEVVTAIELPFDPQPRGSAFLRVTRRRGFDLGTVSVSCLVARGEPARFAFGAVGPTPLLAVDESGVLGPEPGEPAAEGEAIERLLEVTSPISDVRGGCDYRTAMLLALSRRVLTRARERLERGAVGAG
jgi:CO/xanthine dehydrogenase FAD-binding subunit